MPNASPAIYAMMLPGMMQVARSHGYVLAVHGSLLRDFDVAVPWTSDAAAPGVLAEALRERVGGIWSQYDSNGVAGTKPHGRRCWAIHLGGDAYVDLSIMPRLHADWQPDEDRSLRVHLREYEEDALARPVTSRAA